MLFLLFGRLILLAFEHTHTHTHATQLRLITGHVRKFRNSNEYDGLKRLLTIKYANVTAIKQCQKEAKGSNRCCQLPPPPLLFALSTFHFTLCMRNSAENANCGN